MVFAVHCGIGCEPVVFSVDCRLAVSKEQSVLDCDFLSGEAPSCWRFWARRARISVDILELGSFPSWQGGK